MSDSVSGNQLLRMLGNRKLLILFVTLVTFAVALAVTLNQPRIYTAQSSILVDGTEPANAIERRPERRLEPNYMTTQLGILSSIRVAELAVDQLLNEGKTLEELTPQPETKGLGQQVSEVAKIWLDKLGLVDVETEKRTTLARAPATRESVIDYISHALDANVAANSRIMHLAIDDKNPETAALIVNAVADAYVETRLALSQNPAQRIAEWLDLKLADYRIRLTEAQERLSNYQEEKGIVSTDSRLDVEVAYLNSLTTQLVEAEVEAAKSGSRLDQIEQSLRNGTPIESLPEIYSNKIIQDLKANLSVAEGNLSELASEYGLKHPRYQSTEADVQQLRARLQTEIDSAVAGVRSNQAASGVRESKLRTALNSQRTKLLSLRRARGDLPALVNEVENAQRSYETALQEAQRFALIGSLDETNASVLNRATPPTFPSSPNIRRNLMAALSLGLLLGFILALLLEMTQKRVRDADDFSDFEDIPVLAEVPRG